MHLEAVSEQVLQFKLQSLHVELDKYFPLIQDMQLEDEFIQVLQFESHL